MNKYEKVEVASLAKNNVLEVSFTKKNGDVRVMTCTLKEKYLPPQRDLEESVAEKNAGVLAVWDLDKSGWRSFRLESVMNVKIIDWYK